MLFRGEEWYSLCVPPVELRLDITLRNGQAFGWQRVDAAAALEASDKAVKKGRTKRARNASAEVKTEPASSSSALAAASAASAAATSSVAESINQNIDVKLEAPAVKSELTPVLQIVKSEPMDESALPHAAAPAVAVVAPVLPSDSDPVYIGVMGRSLIALRQTESDIYYREILAADDDDAAPTPPAQLDALMRDYLHLPSRTSTGVGAGASAGAHADMLLSSLYPLWSANATRRFRFVSDVYPGVRLLRQDPLECLFSFICSSNNHVSRIGSMLASLRSKYGRRISLRPGALESVLGPGQGQARTPPLEFFAFPTVEELCTATEAELRAIGFGYRARYIVGTAALLRDRGGAAYLSALRARPREEVERTLQDFPGIGPKVAGCIALFSLDQLDAVPVDTHIWKIALRDYAHAAKARGLDLSAVKSLTPKIYQAVGDIFRSAFGAYAGWAHCILFLAELPQFKRTLVERGIDELELERTPTAAESQLLSADDAAETKDEPADEDETTEDDEPADTKPPPPPARKTKSQKQSSANSKPAQATASELSHAFPQRKRSKAAQQ